LVSISRVGEPCPKKNAGIEDAGVGSVSSAALHSLLFVGLLERFMLR